MPKLISTLFATTLICASGAVLAGNDKDTDASRANSGTSTNDVVTGDQGVVSPTDTTTGVGTTGLDQETRAGQNTQEGINTGTRQTPDKNKSR